MSNCRSKNHQILKALSDNLSAISSVKDVKDVKKNNKLDKCHEETKRLIQLMIEIINGKTDKNNQVVIISQLTHEMLQHGTIRQLILLLEYIRFETRKEVVKLVKALLNQQIVSSDHVIEKMFDQKLIYLLISDYNMYEIAQSCGAILRECTNHNTLVRYILQSENFLQLFEFTEIPQLEISYDAFCTLQSALSINKAAASEYLDKNYEEFFSTCYTAINHDNYVSLRYCLMLLSSILHIRANHSVRNRFINDPENLRQMMKLLQHKSAKIKLDSYHIFKLFCVYENKSDDIANILSTNRDKILDYLKNFKSNHDDDKDKFNEEKAYLSKVLRQLPVHQDSKP
ncbi:hypothetical protein A3Q56_03158 [Intoshia linei]|uniref:Uncharacterized protein n=1 Tax=Intoshia linei TaxID=1819745 RepID=A0A177B4E9_9BILA|nr:hypothetical protein A3Q56_03158 [Intoshia linei]